MEYKFFNTILKPISNETKKSCIKLWATNHEEESNKKIDNIKEYCMKNGCDELSILYEIYKEIKSKYLCHIIYLDKFLNQVFNRYDYLSKDEIESKFGEDFTYFYDKTDENNIENMFDVLGVDIYYNKYLTKVNVCDDLLTHYESVHYEERNFDNEFLLIEIEELIDKCISENRKYEYKVILKPKSIEDLEDFEKKLYIPYSKNSNNSYIPTNIGISNLKQEPIDKKEEEKENILFNQEDKYNYDFITKELEPFISGGTPSVYKSIIEKKVLPKGAQMLRAKTIKKVDIYRFSKCFDLTIKQINMIFEEKIKAKNKPKEYVNDFFRVLKGLNPDFNAPK